MRPIIRRRALACAIVFGLLSLLRADSRAVGTGSPNPSAAAQTPFYGLVSTTQAAGELDPTFSGDGKEITNIGGSDYGHGVAIQADGKIVVVGTTFADAGAQLDFAVARYNPDGSLDSTFAGDGTQTTDFHGDSMAAGVAIQADGKIVVVGATNAAGTFDFALARYNPDGLPDEDFSSDGKQTTDFGGYPDAASAVALQPDGKIVVAGRAGDDFGLARYNADGSLDTSFASDGKQTTHLGDSGYDSDYAGAVAIQSDGKIVVAGTTDALPPCDVSIDSCADPPADFALARYNANGTLDTSFSGDGKQTTDFGGDDYAIGIVLQADDRIVAVGNRYVSQTFSCTFALARYNPDGSLDDTFGWGGLLTSQFVGSAAASGVAIQPDGKIVVAGNTSDDFALTRYNPDGSLDETFSGDGAQTTDFGGRDGASGLALQPDGKIVAVGGTWGASGVDFALARYDGESGSPGMTAPDTTITGGPVGNANDSTPTFSFDSSETGSTFECGIDGGAFSACSSPHTTSMLSDGPHIFEVRAADAAGNADPSPASRGFNVDTAPPETTVASGPTGTTTDSIATFSFVSSEGDSTFTCRVDDGTLFPCSSPYTTSPLSDGLHSFQVRATDGAGNTDSTPVSWSWMIVSDYRTLVLATSGLVSYWRVGETSGTIAADATGANSGTYRNGVLLDRPSALLNDSNASASFDGSDDYVSVSDVASLDIGDSFTLEAWVKRSGTSSSTKTVISKGSGSFRLSFVNNVFTLAKSNSGTIAKTSISTTDTTGFHHIVATKSGATVRLYIDGIDRTGTGYQSDDRQHFDGTQHRARHGWLGVLLRPDRRGCDL